MHSDGNYYAPFMTKGTLSDCRLGYGFILLCHKMRDLTAHRDGPSRTTTFLASTHPRNFELTILGASLAATIILFGGVLKDAVSPLYRSL
jgi:hypothetical protein